LPELKELEGLPFIADIDSKVALISTGAVLQLRRQHDDDRSGSDLGLQGRHARRRPLDGLVGRLDRCSTTVP
jgi:hypothetical protein